MMMAEKNDNQVRSLRRVDRLSTVVLFVSAALLIGLAGRVFWLQTNVTSADTGSLQSQHDVRVTLMARRASIYTADSTLIAGSVRVYNMFADPGYIFDPQGNLNALAGAQLAASRKIMADAMGRVLNENPQDFLPWLKSHLYYANGSLRRFIWLQRDADHAFHHRFETIKRGLILRSRRALRDHHPALAQEYFHALDGIGFILSTRRVYPLGNFAGQVIGFTNSEHGLNGLEEQLNSLLVGRNGQAVYVKDAAARALWIKKHNYRLPSDGMRVWLTLDTTIQQIAQYELDKAGKAFKDRSAVAIVMNPWNGDILAMANYPPLNPNTWQKTPQNFWRNRAVTDPYEPGSVFKPFNLSWALKNHVVTLNTVFDTYNGRYRDPTGRLIKDVGGWPKLTVENILVYSSNIGMTQIGWKMGIPMEYQAIHAFGFGRMTGCILPGESPGIVRPESQWTKGMETSVSFGYGIAVTPLQLCRGLCAIANGGWLPTPQIIKAVEVSPGKLETWSQIAGPQPWKKIVPRAIEKQVRMAMEQVMVRGTGQYAISPLYRLFGKTGTANLAVAGQDGYHAHQYNATFIAGGPLPVPRLVCVVAAHEPDPHLGHYGGTVAGPACSAILTRSLQYLQVPPDQGPKTDPWWGKEALLKRLKGLSH
ncbi:MAG: peptidoglycan D,D-transpeptidase FtsI family protein [Phycisphaerae bacterium]